MDGHRPGLRTAGSKAEKTEAKQALRAARAENDEIAAAAFLRAELHRYETPAGRAELAAAQAIAGAGLQGFLTLPQPTKAELKALPRGNADEKAIRTDALRRLRALRLANAAAAKHYPNGIVPFDSAAFDALFAQEDAADAALRANAAAAKAAKERDAWAELPALREAAAGLRKEKAQVQKAIKAATAENSAYHRAAKPYLDALRTLRQAADYTRLQQTEVFEAQTAE